MLMRRTGFSLWPVHIMTLLFGVMLFVGMGEVAQAAGLPQNEQPMFGYDEPKTEEMISADNALIERVIKEDGSREAGARTAIRLGWKYFNQGDLPTSMKRFNQAYLLDSTHGESYIGMAVVLLTRGGDNEEAELLFRRAFDSEKRTEIVYLDYGHFLASADRYQEAEKILASGLEQFPDAYLLRYRRAWMLERLDRSDESVKETKRACADTHRLGNNLRPEDNSVAHAVCAAVGNPLN